MKAEKAEGFVPIVITIETKEEAHNLWHRLNAGANSIKNGSRPSYKYNGKITGEMFNTFDKLYTE